MEVLNTQVSRTQLQEGQIICIVESSETGGFYIEQILTDLIKYQHVCDL